MDMEFVLIQPGTFLMGSPETEFDRYWRITTVMQTAVKDAKRHHKDLTDAKPQDQFKQGYRAALSWLLITLGEDD